MGSGDANRLGPAVQAPAERDDDVAAWALRRGAYTSHWCAPQLQGDRLVASWAARAITHGRCYADLTFRELRMLRECAN